MKQSTTNPRPVDVVGRLEIDAPTGRVEVEGTGRRVVVRFPRVSHAVRAVGGLLRLDRETRFRIFTRLRGALERSQVELRFQIDEREIARIGDRVRPGLVARGFALPGTRTRAIGWIPVGSPSRRERR